MIGQCFGLPKCALKSDYINISLSILIGICQTYDLYLKRANVTHLCDPPSKNDHVKSSERSGTVQIRGKIGSNVAVV